MALIPTIIAVEVGTAEVVLGLLGSGVITAIATGLFMRGKTKAEIHKTNVDADIALADKFIELLDEVTAAKRAALSAEERHSLERIASYEELSDLRDKVEKCEMEHQEWAECKNNMLQFLVKIETELQAMTSQPTLIEAVKCLKCQIEDT